MTGFGRRTKPIARQAALRFSAELFPILKNLVIRAANWHDYSYGLRQLGDFMIWLTEEAIADAKMGARGLLPDPVKHSPLVKQCRRR